MTDERGEILANLKELVLLDAAFGVQTLPRPVETTAPVARVGEGPGARTRTAVKPGGDPVHPPPGTAGLPTGLPARMANPPTAPTARAPVSPPTAPASPTQVLPPIDVTHLADLQTAGDPVVRLKAITERITACDRCGLAAGRSSVVPGEGSSTPEILFVGEGPGAEEDRQGRPFVGPAGQLLDKMIAAMGLSRQTVHIANVVKCRPPQDRDPEVAEMCACLGYLHTQIAVLAPKVICTLGSVALRALTGDLKLGIIKARGRTFAFRDIPLVPTFHPSYLLRNPEAKKPAWEDLKRVLALIGREVPKK